MGRAVVGGRGRLNLDRGRDAADGDGGRGRGGGVVVIAGEAGRDGVSAAVDRGRAALIGDGRLAQVHAAQAINLAGGGVGLAVEGCGIAADLNGWRRLLDGDGRGGHAGGIVQVAAVNGRHGVGADIHGGRAAAVIDLGGGQHGVVVAQHVGRGAVGGAVVGHRDRAQAEGGCLGARRVVHDLDGASLRHRRIVLVAGKRGCHVIGARSDRRQAVGGAIVNLGRAQVRAVQARHLG